jgi:hypothetical protein
MNKLYIIFNMNQLICDMLEILIFINLISIIVFIYIFFISDNNITFSFVNPIVIYNKIKVNWFGAFLIAIIHNICYIIPAVCYWIYKICTVGRK